MGAEAGITVNDREEPVYSPTEAADLKDKVIMCTCLYVQWSLKQDETDGSVTAKDAHAVPY